MNGFLNLLKPPGMTSHDVVQYVRRVIKTKSVGHTGTLDPAAAGVLVLTVGSATRLGEYLLEGDKAYRAEVTLGLATDSADAEGVVTSRASASKVAEPAVRAALAELTGTITMRPPAHSAVRVNGKRLYELARAGAPVEAPERTIEVRELTLLEFLPGQNALVRFDVTCSKGTYIRSLAQMLGEKLGCGGYLSMLLRTAVGVHSISESVTLEDLANDPAGCLLDSREALPHLPQMTATPSQCELLQRGQASDANESLPPGPVLVYNADQQLVCLAEAVAANPPRLQPRKVFIAR